MSGITVHEEFEIVDEPFDAWWDVQIPTSEIEYFDMAPSKDQPAKGATSSPPVSPLKMIKETIHQDVSQIREHKPSKVTPLLIKTRDPLAIVRRPPPPNFSTTIQVGTPTATLWAREVYIHKMLLLNAYPIGYILLWAPGIANRFAELTGHHYRFLAIAQASTQFVGLANARKYSFTSTLGISRYFRHAK